MNLKRIMALLLAVVMMSSNIVFADELFMDADTLVDDEPLLISPAPEKADGENAAETTEKADTTADTESTETAKETDSAETAETTETAEQTTPVIPEIEFTDVPKTAPYYEEVKKLVTNGIIKGYGDGTFRPDETVTRAEMAAVIRRYTEKVIENGGE